MDTYQQRSRVKLIATVVTILVIAGVVVIVDRMKSHTKTDTSTQASVTTAPTTVATTTTPTTNTDSTAASTTSGTAKDGSYTATVDYSVPNGNENIAVSLTLKDGVVTDATVKNSENDDESARYQEDFAAKYKTYVVGKKITEIKVPTIAGASDTAQGFNDAVSQIVSKAKA